MSEDPLDRLIRPRPVDVERTNGSRRPESEDTVDFLEDEDEEPDEDAHSEEAEETRESRSTSNGLPRRSRSVAPVWVGNCLRLAGDASAPCLILQQRQGARTALAYSYQAAVRLKDGGESIEIEFVGHMVAIQGTRLQLVFEALASHRALELAESRTEFDEGDDEPRIVTIAIVSTQEH